MENVIPKISSHDQEILDIIGLKPLHKKTLPSLINPNHWHYWALNAAVMLKLDWVRTRLTMYRAPRALVTFTICFIPVLGIYDHQYWRHGYYMFSNNTLKKDLLMKPELRSAYEEAMEVNREYQEGLRKEIAELEGRQD